MNELTTDELMNHFLHVVNQAETMFERHDNREDEMRSIRRLMMHALDLILELADDVNEDERTNCEVCDII